MARKEVTKAMRAIRRHAKASTQYHADQSGRTGYATVLGVDPWGLELHDTGFTLDEDEITLTQWVRKYDVDHGVDVGDTVLVTEMANGDFLVRDVISNKAVG